MTAAALKDDDITSKIIVVIIIIVYNRHILNFMLLSIIHFISIFLPTQYSKDHHTHTMSSQSHSARVNIHATMTFYSQWLGSPSDFFVY